MAAESSSSSSRLRPPVGDDPNDVEEFPLGWRRRRSGSRRRSTPRCSISCGVGIGPFGRSGLRRINQLLRERSAAESERQVLNGLDPTTHAELALKDAAKVANVRSDSPKSYFLKANALILGTISFGAGFFLVLIGWAVMGMILESYGFIVLFRGFWPTLAVFMQRIPVLGWIFQQPYVTSFFNRYRGKRVPV